MNTLTRRAVVKHAAALGFAAGVRAQAAQRGSSDELALVADKPVLDVSFLKQPVKVSSVELLRNGRAVLVRALG